MKNTREHFAQKDSDRKSIFFSKFFKLRYSTKYKAEVWVFDPLAVFNSREKLVMFRDK
jgi:hypothetical protein